jgi:hypothetical protein
MPVSTTTPGRLGARDIAPIRIAFRQRNDVDAREKGTFAAQWQACALPRWCGSGRIFFDRIGQRAERLRTSGLRDELLRVATAEEIVRVAYTIACGVMLMLIIMIAFARSRADKPE